MLDKRPSNDVLNNCEMFYVRMHQFFSFIVETHLEDDANLDIGQIENIFSIVDAPDKATAANDPHNVKLCLNRHEWLQCLVQLCARPQLPKPLLVFCLSSAHSPCFSVRVL